MERFSRTELLLGKEKMKRLSRSFVTVIGLGAVGSYAVEALARAGVGRLRLVDFDTVRATNVNRHIWAYTSTIGKPKAHVARLRAHDINPSCKIEELELFAAADTFDRIFDAVPDLVIDAVDSVTPKIQLLAECCRRKIPVISSMGAATRTDPALIRTGDLFDTHGCPLASSIRRLLRKAGIGRGITCVYSSERTHAGRRGVHLAEDGEYKRGRPRRTLGSLSTVTGMFGLIAAHTAVDRLTGGFHPE